ncbi:MAG TPA: transglutaminaseTgpA domain-containing protein [Gaiellaceae bacterium]|nr:transglutaminaseTgpA domain-containing protein [Gaiellaceae bacterium]
MARRAGLVVLVAALVAGSWLRLEQLSVSWRDWLPMLLLALLPILAVGLGRSRLVVAGVLAASTLLAARVAFEIPLSEARPFDPQRDFFGPVLDGIRQGFLDFYETQLPFDRIDYPLMHAMVLLAVFGLTALTGMLVMARRPVGAALALVVAIGWPATLTPGDSPLRAGVLALVGVLAVLFLLRRDEPARGVLQGAGVALVLVAVAVTASTFDSVAKGAFLSWQSWDPYDRPTEPVSVEYVWNANYDGITFPEKATTVLRVKVSGSRRSLYWRATTLDDYTGRVWDEELELGEAEQREEIDAVGRNPMLPEAAGNEENWVRQDVTVEALRDRHLLASAQPVRWRPGTDAPVADADGDVVLVPDSLRRDQRYTVWSYVPRPNPSDLASFEGDYPDEAARWLEVVYQPVPEWSARSRDTRMAVFFGAEHEDEFEIEALEALYEQARGVTSGTESPYEAAVLLETWFREAGGFVYDEQPPGALGGTPPLVDFVIETKRGYCQHYAGGMALMLRLLGIPARVAVGFTSGTYDQDDKEWIVSDTNAHAWVEVWFPRYGWIPFDPTPGRGQLAATYSAYSGAFNAGDAAEIGLDGRLEGLSPALAEQIRAANDRPGLAGQGVGNPGSGGAVSVVRDRGPSLLVLVLLVLGGAYAAIVLLKAVRRSARFATRDPRALAGACRRDLVGYLADQGIELPSSATLTEIGAALDRYYAVNADPFVRDLTVARFGSPADAPEALGRARRELRDLRRLLRRRLTVVNRLRGAASLRSLAL